MRNLLIVIFASLLASCASSPQVPEWVSAPNRCSVLLGGGGTVTPNSGVNDNWFKINSALSNKLAASLGAKKYRIDSLIVDIRDNGSRIKAASAELNRSQCNKIVQVSHVLTSSGGIIDGFQFKLDILGVASESSVLTFTREYEKVYSFKMTKEVMESLSLGSLAEQMASDLQGSGVLRPAAE